MTTPSSRPGLSRSATRPLPEEKGTFKVVYSHTLVWPGHGTHRTAPTAYIAFRERAVYSNTDQIPLLFLSTYWLKIEEISKFGTLRLYLHLSSQLADCLPVRKASIARVGVIYTALQASKSSYGVLGGTQDRRYALAKVYGGTQAV